jgi:hypothetical protein
MATREPEEERDERPEERLRETGRRLDEAREAVAPEPGLTAPLDDYTEDERRMGPQGSMPGSGPDAGGSDAVERVHDDSEPDGEGASAGHEPDGPGPVETAAAHDEQEDAPG